MFVFIFLLILFGYANSQNATSAMNAMNARNEIVNIKVGMLIPNGSSLDNDVGYKTSVGAIVVALNKAIQDKIYNPALYNITFIWNFTQCSEYLAVGYASKMIKYDNVSALFGPTCIESAELVGSLAAYTNTPVFLWSTVNANFIDRTKFPTVISAAGTVSGLSTALANVLKNYNWTQIGFLYTTVDGSNAEHVPFCEDFAATMLTVASTTFINITTYSRYIVNSTVNSFQSNLNAINTRARIIVTCLETKADRQNLMLAATANKMIGADYVYLFIQTSASGFGANPFWEGSGVSESIIKEAAKSVLILDKYAEETSIKDAVDKKIVDNARGWPFYCKDCPSNANASNLAFYLGDAFYTYLMCLNWTYTKYGSSQLANTTAVLERLISNSTVIPSIMGNNFTSTRGFRSGRYALWGMDSYGVATVFGISYTLLTDTGDDFTEKYTNETTSIWSIRGGKKPLSKPICGFNNICMPSPIIYVSLVAASIVLFLSIILGLFILILMCQRQQRKRLNALWQINFIYLQRQEDKSDSIQKSSRSIHSFASQSSSQSTYLVKKATEHTDYFIYDGDLVVAQKHPYYGRWSVAEEEEFRKMRKLDNSKLNRFLGLSVYQNTVYTIWNYCDRGNIIEVIKTHAFRIDAYIMIGMMREIADGLLYIHNSIFVQHGNLNAYNCVVGDRFDVKIQMYGCSGFKSRSVRRQNSKCALYVAPEHLHGSQNKTGSQAGDIYSFGILASVILTMSPAFGIEDVNNIDLIEETVRRVASGRYPPVRPSLESDNSVDIHPELFELARKCWNELPLERPKIEEVRETLIKRSQNNGKSLNLMDHMFALMENSAAELEQDVKMRTIELQDAQKRADVLLYRIMPRQAADKLKLGQLVESEVFEQASVFFSDIVSFTVLASKSTPLQIINFLNEVYTLADSVIDKFDVYKVETIGDGMHVVSGVPKRNGNAHVKEITNMAVDFQRAVKTLRLSHLPNEEILMRVGVHSGIVVAGIVGMTNPRYIVLGDTVNLSAKMEASGRAGRIHITRETKDLINQYYPNQFHIFDRGETLIKGVGPMNTYWVALPEEASKFES